MHDPNTEQFLRRLGVTFTLKQKVPLSEIDMVEARANPARAYRAINDEALLKYSLAMQRGDDFVAIVLIKRSTSRLYILATGLHRVIAALEWVKPTPLLYLDAYICDCHDDPAKETLVIHALNSINGLAPTYDEELELACEAKRLYPNTPTREIAAAFSRNEQTIQNHFNQQKGEERAHRLKCDGQFGALSSQKLKLGLNGIQNDNWFQRATLFAFDAKLGGQDADDFVRDVKGCRTERAFNDYMDKREEKLRQQKLATNAVRNRGGRTPAQVLESISKTIVRKDISMVVASFIDADLANNLACYEAAVEKLTKIIRIGKARLHAKSPSPAGAGP